MGGVSAQPTQSATFGSLTVDLAGQGFFNVSAAADLAPLDPGILDFFRDYYFNNSNTTGNGVTVAITGVTPNTPYNLTVWSYDPSAPSPGGVITWSPLTGSNTTGGSAAITNARTPAPTTLLDPAHYATISLTSTTNVLQFFGTRTGGTNGGTRLNGFKLDDGTNDLLAVDMGVGGPTSLSQPGFVSAVGTDAQSTFSQVEGAYTVSLAGQGFFNTTSAAGVALLDPSVRDLYRDYYYANGALGTVQLSIEGVTPNTDYDLTLWSYDADTTQATPVTWTPTGDTTGPVGTIVNIRTPAPTSIYDPDNTTTIRVRSASTTLNLLGARPSGGNGGVRLNAIELNAVQAGDFDGDGDVDGADFVAWQTNFPLENGATLGQGDADHDGDVDGADFSVWQSNFPASPSPGASPVPEPSALLLLTGLGIIGFTARRRLFQVSRSA